MPHLVEFDHDGAALGLGFLGVDFGEALDPGLHARRRHARQLGGAVHRQPAQVEEHRRDLDPERHAARRRVGEVQPAGPAAVALLAAHEPVLDVLPAPAPLAPQRHPFTPSATPPPMDMGDLCGVETLKLDKGLIDIRTARSLVPFAFHYVTRPDSRRPKMIVGYYFIGMNGPEHAAYDTGDIESQNLHRNHIMCLWNRSDRIFFSSPERKVPHINVKL